MPTFEWLADFGSDFRTLTPAQKAAFLVAVARFVEDLRGGEGLRPGLRVKRVRGTSGVFEMTWAGDGRATFQYGDPVHPGQPHIIWRRIGTHDILKRP